MLRLSPDTVGRIVSEFEGVDLGDPRRGRRLLQIVGDLAAEPDVSLPDAMGGAAKLEALYRFANNSAVTLTSLLEGHRAKTVGRAREAGTVYAIHDTTAVACVGADAEDVGYLNTGKAGFYMHYALVVAAGSRRPLGIPFVEIFSRDKPPSKRGRVKRQKAGGAQTRKKEDRESLRWGRGLGAVQADLEDTNVIHIADREVDSFELHAENIARGRRFVFRLRVNRNARIEGEDGLIRELAVRTQGRFSRDVPLSARADSSKLPRRFRQPLRAARTAQLAFSAAPVEIQPPRYLRAEHPNPLRLNLVRVWEVDPPADEPAVEWLLYTTEPIGSDEEIGAVVDIYRARWLIEECNKALKTGCLLEQREFESRHAMLTILAMSLPIACEVLALRAASRERPDAPASEMLTDVQLNLLRVIGGAKLSASPTLLEALLAVAALGGHVKANGPPGWRVLQRGMQKILAYEEGWRAHERANL